MMRHIVYEDDFSASVAQLPKLQQEKLARLLPLLAEDPFHPLLHSKRLTGTFGGFLSFRITRDWRVLYQFPDPYTIRLILAGHRKDIYR